jgi:hypothetical protein
LVLNSNEGGEDGLDFVRTILKSIVTQTEAKVPKKSKKLTEILSSEPEHSVLSENGILIVEAGANQRSTVEKEFPSILNSISLYYLF